jgi:hypothetical protein
VEKGSEEMDEFIEVDCLGCGRRVEVYRFDSRLCEDCHRDDTRRVKP